MVKLFEVIITLDSIHREVLNDNFGVHRYSISAPDALPHDIMNHENIEHETIADSDAFSVSSLEEEVNSFGAGTDFCH